MVTPTDFEKSVVAVACWQATVERTYPNLISIGSVFRNRAEAGWFDKSIYWNAVASMRGSESPDFPDVRDPVFQMLLQGVSGLFDGRASDKTGGALYYASASSEETISGTVTAHIGQTIFFK